MKAVFLTFILMPAIFLGFELINKVPSSLHTPLMSGANAISGIIETEQANLRMETFDIAMVIGANDVVNPD